MAQWLQDTGKAHESIIFYGSVTFYEPIKEYDFNMCINIHPDYSRRHACPALLQFISYYHQCDRVFMIFDTKLLSKLIIFMKCYGMKGSRLEDPFLSVEVSSEIFGQASFPVACKHRKGLLTWALNLMRLQNLCVIC